jgi:hypothetical protein
VYFPKANDDITYSSMFRAAKAPLELPFFTVKLFLKLTGIRELPGILTVARDKAFGLCSAGLARSY